MKEPPPPPPPPDSATKTLSHNVVSQLLSQSSLCLEDGGQTYIKA